MDSNTPLIVVLLDVRKSVIYGWYETKNMITIEQGGIR